MSKKSPTAVAQTSPSANRFDAYSVREYEANGEKRSDWTRIGVAFAHADGEGFYVLLQARAVSCNESRIRSISAKFRPVLMG